MGAVAQIATLVSALSAAAGTAMAVKQQKMATKTEAAQRKKAEQARMEKRKEEELLKTKSPAKRLLGGRPTL